MISNLIELKKLVILIIASTFIIGCQGDQEDIINSETSVEGRIDNYA